MKLVDQEFFWCIEGRFKCRSNKVTSFMDLCEYKASNLHFGLVDLVICCILHILVNFVSDFGIEGTSSPFEHFGMSLGPFGVRNFGFFSFPLSYEAVWSFRSFFSVIV